MAAPTKTFKWPCLECSEWTRERCSRCALSLCTTCQDKFHRPPCDPPPLQEEWNIRMFKRYGFRFDGQNMAQLPLPEYGAKDELPDLLFPWPHTGVANIPGVFCAQSELKKHNPNWFRSQSGIIKKQWDYLVPRLMLPTAVAMLTQEQHAGLKKHIGKAHKEIYEYYYKRLNELQEKLGTRGFEAVCELALATYPQAKNDKGRKPETFLQLALSLQDQLSVEDPSRPAYGARFPQEMRKWLKHPSVQAPDDWLQILDDVREHYTSGPGAAPPS